MSQSQPASTLEKAKVGERNVNDFCITFSTVNGSGSATANTGKNIFPSNIQGMATWYSIRLSKKGYLARVEKDNIVVAMNPATIAREFEFILPGGVLFYADNIKPEIPRDDIVAYPMPVRSLVKSADVPSNLRDYVANMVYVGVVAQMLGIDLDTVYEVLDSHFKGKKKAVDSNWSIISAAAQWARENLEKRDPYYVERMPAIENSIMTDGNTACALGAIYGGVQFAAWYPITPASSLAESLIDHLPRLRQDPETGKATYAVVQAEDELAAAGMAIGAGWSGLRSMTSTSGPGLSLMAEYLGLAYFAEIPLVLFDVQRVGPSTGLPTRTAQGDLTFINFLGHGDTQYVILLPGNINECFEFSWKAFDYAERFQTPVIVLSDLDMGMNTHLAHRFEYPDTEIDRGKILWEDDLEKILERTKGEWGRYLDLDGDGIPYRTVPGNRSHKAAYFARGTGHDEQTRYTEDPEVFERTLKRIRSKLELNKGILPQAIVQTMKGSKIGIVAFGSTDPAIQEARDLLLDAGVPTDYMRVRSLPFSEDICDFLSNYRRTYVIELNRDGQMKQLLTMHYSECGSRLRQVSHIDGMPISADWIRRTILAMEEEEK